jgi:hypothetical protein
MAALSCEEVERLDGPGTDAVLVRPTTVPDDVFRSTAVLDHRCRRTGAV